MGDLKQQVLSTNATGTTGRVAATTTGSARAIGRAVAHLYAEGGLAAFWVGNGLNVVKIFPVSGLLYQLVVYAPDHLNCLFKPQQESAIKFLSYESSKRLFARYVDGVEDPRYISGTSRFISGGIGGITSQLCKSC